MREKLWACWRCNWLNNWEAKSCAYCGQKMRLSLAALFVALLALPAPASAACMSLAEARAAYPGKHLTYRLVNRARCWDDHGQARAWRRPGPQTMPAPAPRLSVLWPVLAGAEPPGAAALYHAEPMTRYPLLLDIDAITAPGVSDASGNQAADYCCWPALEADFRERWLAMPSNWFLAAIGEGLK